MWLSGKPSRLRLKEAQNARKNRQEIIKARSLGQITRRDLLKWGLITAGGALAWKHGLNPFVRSAYAGIPTGLPPSPLFGQLPFTQPMPRFDVLVRNANPFTFLAPAPTKEANTTQQPLDPRLPGVAPGDTGPIEGRPPGAIWAHQGWEQFLPQIAIEVTQEGAKNNTTYRPEVPSSLNSDIDPTQAIPVRFHPGFPTQQQNSVWTFNGTVPPKLAQVRYGEPVRCFPHQTSGGHRILPPSSALHTDASTLAGKTVPPLRQPCSGKEGATVVPPNRKAVPQRTGESIPESTLRHSDHSTVSTVSQRTDEAVPESTTALLRELVSIQGENRKQLREEWARRVTESRLFTAMKVTTVHAPPGAPCSKHAHSRRSHSGTTTPRDRVCRGAGLPQATADAAGVAAATRPVGHRSLATHRWPTNTGHGAPAAAADPSSRVGLPGARDCAPPLPGTGTSI